MAMRFLLRSTLRVPALGLRRCTGGVAPLPPGWQAIYSAEHGRQYYWHQPTGTSQWLPPAPTPPGPEVPEGWETLYSEADRRHYFWHKASGRTQWTPPQPAQASAPGAAVVPSATSAASQEQGSEAMLPEGWQAVFSQEHGRNFFWHKPTGETTWQLPDGTAASAGGRPSAEDVLRSWQGILHGATLGQELQGQQLRVAEELLSHHPEATQKLGPGLRGMKVDAAPPPHSAEARCFWVLRVDGSEEDFSARKCVRALRESHRL
eukprot:TRINITY_DN60966_c0_g1_i1.p1 TRINITY_DN60966_c0_g1~~TRINITY_DN60966_c0_g1_i1.p1  ORF type:complete len:263 (-),score=44.49 TRINITY_DN60966_c0_g1_i1:25-813(-)